VVQNHPYAWDSDVRRFHAVEGTVYMIAVDARYSDDYSVGDFSVSVALAQVPPNDDLPNAEVETGSAWSASGNNAAATLEPGESFGYVLGSWYPYSAGARTVWYSWTAPATASAKIDPAGSGFGTIVSVYTGDSVSGLVPVAGKYDPLDSKPGTTGARFRAVEGTTYRIQVDGLSGDAAGDVKLALSTSDLPANDMFADAVDLGSSDTAGAEGHNDAATSETGEPQHYPYNYTSGSVWYSWTAPRRGSLTIKATAPFQSVLAAYTGDTVSGLTRVTNQPQDYNGGAEQIRIRVEAGVTYRIAVGSLYLAGGGDFSLSLKLIDSPANDDLADASVLAGADLEVDGTNRGATQEPCEPVHEQNYYDPSVWYEWTAPATGGAEIEMSGELNGAILGVYTGASMCTLVRVNTTRSTVNRAKRRFRAVAGVTYRIAVDGPGAHQGGFHLALHQPASPANDMFALAEPLLGKDASATGNNIGATGEDGEPAAHGGTAGASVWYSWTAPADGRARLTLDSSDFAASLGVYTGDSVDSLTEVASGWSYTFRTFGVKEGVTYRIAVHGGAAAARGEFGISLVMDEPPANDDFAHASGLTGQVAEADGTNRGATRESGEPSTYYELNSSVWYRWKAPVTGLAWLRFSNGYHYATAYTGSALDQLTPRGSGWGSPGFWVTAGETYLIAVDGSDYDTQSDFHLTLTETVPPLNDAAANATPLEGSVDSATGSTVDGSYDSYDRDYVDGAGTEGRGIWYSWRAPADGPVTVDTLGSDFDTVLGAYVGDPWSLAAVAENASVEPGVVDQSKVSFEAVKGTLYRFFVDGQRYGTTRWGSVKIHLEHASPPKDDDFAAATPLTGAGDEATGSNVGAAKEAHEPNHGANRGGASVWYRWTAPQDGTLELSTAGSGFDTLLGVYTGDSLGALSKVASADGSALTAQVKAGTTYRIAVDGRNDGEGPGEGSVKLALDLKDTGPLDVRAMVLHRPIADVLDHGLVVVAACDRACGVTYRIVLKGAVVGTARGVGGPQKRIALRLAKADRQRLRRVAKLALTIRADARAGRQTDSTSVRALLRK
jgi:hypothetical protein